MEPAPWGDLFLSRCECRWVQGNLTVPIPMRLHSADAYPSEGIPVSFLGHVPRAVVSGTAKAKRYHRIETSGMGSARPAAAQLGSCLWGNSTGHLLCGLAPASRQGGSTSGASLGWVLHSGSELDGHSCPHSLFISWLGMWAGLVVISQKEASVLSFQPNRRQFLSP